MNSRTPLPAVGTLWVEPETGHVAEVLSYHRARWRVGLRWLGAAAMHEDCELPRGSFVPAFRPAAPEDLAQACLLTRCLTEAAARALVDEDRLSALRESLLLVGRDVPVAVLRALTGKERDDASAWLARARSRALRLARRVRLPDEPEFLTAFRPARHGPEQT